MRRLVYQNWLGIIGFRIVFLMKLAKEEKRRDSCLINVTYLAVGSFQLFKYRLKSYLKI